jgi:predicted acyltransferase
VIYILSGLIAQFLGMLPGGEDGSAYGWIYNNIFKPIDPYLGSFLFALMIMFICWLVGWWMDKRRVYIRV